MDALIAGLFSAMFVWLGAVLGIRQMATPIVLIVSIMAGILGSIVLIYRY